MNCSRGKNHPMQTNERDVPQPAQTHVAKRLDSESKIADNMALRFKNQDIFTGKLVEDLPEHICNYIDATQDYKSSTKQTNLRSSTTFPIVKPNNSILRNSKTDMELSGELAQLCE